MTSQDPERHLSGIGEIWSGDLDKLAGQGKLDPVIGRDDEIRRTIQILSRRTKNNPVLIGEPGVGKTAIVEGLAQRIVKGDVPEGLKQKRSRAGHGSLGGRRQVPWRIEERLKAVPRNPGGRAGPAFYRRTPYGRGSRSCGRRNGCGESSQADVGKR